MILIKNPSWVKSLKSSIFCSWPCVFLLLFMAVANIEVRARPLPLADYGTLTIQDAPLEFNEDGSYYYSYSEDPEPEVIKASEPEPELSSKTSDDYYDDDLSEYNVRGADVDDYTGFWKDVNATNYQAFYKKLSFAVADFLTHLNCSSLQELGAGREEYATVLKEHELFLSCYNGNHQNLDTQGHNEPDSIQGLSHRGCLAALDLTNKAVNLATHEWKLSLYIGNSIPIEFLDIFLNNLDEAEANLKGMTFTLRLDTTEVDDVNRRMMDFLKSKMSNLGYTNDLEEERSLRFEKNVVTKTTTTNPTDTVEETEEERSLRFEKNVVTETTTTNPSYLADTGITNISRSKKQPRSDNFFHSPWYYFYVFMFIICISLGRPDDDAQD